MPARKLMCTVTTTMELYERWLATCLSYDLPQVVVVQPILVADLVAKEVVVTKPPVRLYTLT